MSIWRMLRVTEQINRGHRPTKAPETSEKAPDAPPAGPAGASGYDRLVVLPEGPRIEPGPLPVETQVLLRIMGEDMVTAKELIKSMRPVDRAILIFYAREIEFLVSEINESEGRY